MFCLDGVQTPNWATFCKSSLSGYQTDPLPLIQNERKVYSAPRWTYNSHNTGQYWACPGVLCPRGRCGRKVTALLCPAPTLPQPLLCPVGGWQGLWELPQWLTADTKWAFHWNMKPPVLPFVKLTLAATLLPILANTSLQRAPPDPKHPILYWSPYPCTKTHCTDLGCTRLWQWQRLST